MFRSALVTATLALGLASFVEAQVVNNGGFVTTAPSANVTQNPSVVNAQGAPSVPAINTPVAHVGPQAGIANQPGQQAAGVERGNGVAATEPGVVQVSATNQNGQPFDLGVASVTTNPFLEPGSGDNGKSLGDVAREMKQKDQNLNAKTYTNADIDRINQATGVSNNAVNASNYPANNGVITPPSNNENSIAAPVQNQSTTGNAPFSSRPSNNATPAANDNSTQQLPPQANAKPSAGQPYQMAANNPPSMGTPQSNANQNNSTNEASNDSQSQSNDSGKELPKTASRLPLIGVLGFFSISMGLFVRYQREKSSK